MVDQNARERLSQSLVLLVNGEMTNDEFDELYYDWFHSQDRAVQEISQFGWSLYSSDLLFPYSLKGAYEVDSETRRDAERCALFLSTSLEYEWPKFPDNSPWGCLAGMGCFFLGPLGITLLVITVVTLTQRDWAFATGAAVGGVFLLAFSGLAMRNCGRRDTREWKHFYASGDFEWWPFLRREHFDKLT